MSCREGMNFRLNGPSVSREFLFAVGGKRRREFSVVEAGGRLHGREREREDICGRCQSFGGTNGWGSQGGGRGLAPGEDVLDVEPGCSVRDEV